MLPGAQSFVLSLVIAASTAGVPAVAGAARGAPAPAAPAGTEGVAPEVESQEVTLEPVTSSASDAPVTKAPATKAPATEGSVTEAVSAPQERDEFGIVGVSIPADDMVDGLVVEVRTRQDSGWTDWEPLELDLDAGRDAASTQAVGAAEYIVSEPLVALESDAVQVRLTSDSEQSLPTDVRATTIDPGTTKDDTAVLGYTTTAANAGLAALPMPAVVTRAGWGADESRRTLNPGCGTPSYASSLKGASLNHTAGTNSYTPEQVPAIIRGIYAFHTNPASQGGRGWCDMGYNALVDKWGRVFEGRYGGLDRPVIGAHAGGFNYGTFGISILGNYDEAEVPPTAASAVAQMIAWKFSVGGVDPMARVTLTSAGSTRYAAGQQVNLPTVFGHRDVSLTACPGKNAYPLLGSIRSRASQIMTNAVTVQAWYQDFLGRSADAGSSSWRSLLDDGADRTQVLSLFLTNREYLSREVNTYYQSAFGRNADAAGLDGWVRAVQTGQFALENVAELLYQSEEFYQRSGGSDTAYVKSIYQAVLARTATDHEASAWADDISRYGRGIVVNRIWRSVEGGQRRITANYQMLLGRAPDPGGLQGWTAYELILGDAAVRAALATSTEYLIRAAHRF